MRTSFIVILTLGLCTCSSTQKQEQNSRITKETQEGPKFFKFSFNHENEKLKPIKHETPPNKLTPNNPRALEKNQKSIKRTGNSLEKP